MEKDIDLVEHVLFLVVGEAVGALELDAEPHAVPLGGLRLEPRVVGVALAAVPRVGVRLHPVGGVGEDVKALQNLDKK